ncbi:MAG: hypothetical protein IKK24_05860 [Clostridia bacterium]|nr:hypothetical protein [Clostridia bacterium]
MKFRIADFDFIFHCKWTNINSQAELFVCDNPYCDLEITMSQTDIEKEKLISDEKRCEESAYEVTAVYRKLGEWLPLHNAFVLHSAVIDVDGQGVAFAAHSGTGKTTHMMLWQKLLGERMTIVNGDKPIVRFFDDEPQTPYAYGTPWNGKERLGCNMRTPVKHICFIVRSETNYVEPMEASEIIDLIFNQVYMPKDPMAAVNTIQLINRFIGSCKLWKIHCNMDISAAETAYKALFE